ncbi:MAG TPA: hypothetical protein VHQ91_07095 [Geminicoccaceae bacterium]|nr:hypothetical protein [Geminicoccaceae bacterium]
MPGEIPDHIRRVLDAGMAEGVAWKFAPLRLFPDRHELALDNDCIVWAMPEALRAWLQGGDRCLIAEGVRLGFGQFPDLCGPEPRNSGIRGLPPGFDLGDALAGVLARPPTKLRSELDEQGLQVAAISRPRPPLVVRVDEVTVCSPFHPHVSELGRCGAHSSASTFAISLGDIMAGRPTTARLRTWRATARRCIKRSGSSSRARPLSITSGRPRPINARRADRGRRDLARGAPHPGPAILLASGVGGSLRRRTRRRSRRGQGCSPSSR